MNKFISTIILIFFCWSHSVADELKARSDNYEYGKAEGKEGSKIITRGSGGKIKIKINKR